MSNFNLQVKDYNINELKDLLNLIDPYTLEDIVNNENILREKLLMDPNVSNEKKKGISTFLQASKAILIKIKKEEFVNTPTDELVGNYNHPVPKRIHDVVEKINAVPRDETTDDKVDKNTLHKLLCIDSRFRDNYYTTLSTNYKTTLPTVVKNVVSMELSALEFPTTYFQISKSLGNNFFWIKWSDPVRTLLTSVLTNTQQTPDCTPMASSEILLYDNTGTCLTGTSLLDGETVVFTYPDDPCLKKCPDGTPATGVPISHVPTTDVQSSSIIENFTPIQLWYYISIPDGNYQRAQMMREINEQFAISLQSKMSIVYLFEQLGAYYDLPQSSPPPFDFCDGSTGTTKAWIPQGHLMKFIFGSTALPQASIDDVSLRTVISYVKGNAKWNPVCGKDVDGTLIYFPNNTDPAFSNYIKFAYAPELTADILFEAINNPDCDSWLSLFFNRSSGGRGSTSFIGEPETSLSSRYSGGIDIEPPLDLRNNGGIVSNYGWVLGYRLGFYKGSTAYVSEGCYDGWGVKYIYLIVNDYNKNVNNFCIPAYNESLGRTNILARVSTNAVANADFGSGISLTNNVNNDNSIRKRIYFGPVDISRLELQITDEMGRILDLNNMDWSAAINLICLYD